MVSAKKGAIVSVAALGRTASAEQQQQANKKEKEASGVDVGSAASGLANLLPQSAQDFTGAGSGFTMPGSYADPEDWTTYRPPVENAAQSMLSHLKEDTHKWFPTTHEWEDPDALAAHYAQLSDKDWFDAVGNPLVTGVSDLLKALGSEALAEFTSLLGQVGELAVNGATDYGRAVTSLTGMITWIVSQADAAADSKKKYDAFWRDPARSSLLLLGPEPYVDYANADCYDLSFTQALLNPGTLGWHNKEKLLNQTFNECWAYCEDDPSCFSIVWGPGMDLLANRSRDSPRRGDCYLKRQGCDLRISKTDHWGMHVRAKRGIAVDPTKTDKATINALKPLLRKVSEVETPALMAALELNTAVVQAVEFNPELVGRRNDASSRSSAMKGKAESTSPSLSGDIGYGLAGAVMRSGDYGWNQNNAPLLLEHLVYTFPRHVIWEKEEFCDRDHVCMADYDRAKNGAKDATTTTDDVCRWLFARVQTAEKFQEIFNREQADAKKPKNSQLRKLTGRELLLLKSPAKASLHFWRWAATEESVAVQLKRRQAQRRTADALAKVLLEVKAKADAKQKEKGERDDIAAISPGIGGAEALLIQTLQKQVRDLQRANEQLLGGLAVAFREDRIFEVQWHNGAGTGIGTGKTSAATTDTTGTSTDPTGTSTDTSSSTYLKEGVIGGAVVLGGLLFLFGLCRFVVPFLKRQHRNRQHRKDERRRQTVIAAAEEASLNVLRRQQTLQTLNRQETMLTTTHPDQHHDPPGYDQHPPPPSYGRSRTARGTILGGGQLYNNSTTTTNGMRIPSTPPPTPPTTSSSSSFHFVGAPNLSTRGSRSSKAVHHQEVVGGSRRGRATSAFPMQLSSTPRIAALRNIENPRDIEQQQQKLEVVDEGNVDVDVADADGSTIDQRQGEHEHQGERRLAPYSLLPQRGQVISYHLEHQLQQEQHHESDRLTTPEQHRSVHCDLPIQTANLAATANAAVHYDLATYDLATEEDEDCTPHDLTLTEEDSTHLHDDGFHVERQGGDHQLYGARPVGHVDGHLDVVKALGEEEEEGKGEAPGAQQHNNNSATPGYSRNGYNNNSATTGPTVTGQVWPRHNTQHNTQTTHFNYNSNATSSNNAGMVASQTHSHSASPSAASQLATTTRSSRLNKGGTKGGPPGVFMAATKGQRKGGRKGAESEAGSFLQDRARLRRKPASYFGEDNTV